MKHADSPLAFVQACTVQPTQQMSVAQWQQAALADLATEGSSTYRVLTTWQFSEVGQRADAWCADQAVRPHVQRDTQFASASTSSQADLAEAALQGLIQSLRTTGVNISTEAGLPCSVAVYATSGVDENFFQSSISRLVCGVGMSRVPHFGVAQWQGASWIGAMDIIHSLSAEQEGAYSALLVCTEKWPTPFPRVLSLPAVLADGAAALWIQRVGDHLDKPALVCVDTAMRSSAPYVTLPAPEQDGLPAVDRARILTEACDLMVELLQTHDLNPTDIQGWLPSGLGPDWERALQDSLGLDGLGRSSTLDEHTSGYLCAASGPVFIERLLKEASAGRITDGARFLSWGMSLGGTVGVALLQARCPQAHGVLS